MAKVEIKKKSIPISIIFMLILVLSFFIIKPYIISVIMAFIWASIAKPLYKKILKIVKWKTNLSSSITIIIIILWVIIPIWFILTIALNQAWTVLEEFYKWTQNIMENPGDMPDYLVKIINYISLSDILEKASWFVWKIGNVLLSSIGFVWNITITAALKIFIFLYSMFFFIQDDGKIIKSIVSYIPIPIKDSEKIIKSIRITVKATIKSTAIIWLIQWTLAGIWFWVVWVPWALFWWVLMVLLSVVPLLWATIIWVPACFYLILSWEITASISLAVYCWLLVWSVDNLLRPRLVWKDVWIHEILILISTLWWIALFWISGFIIWPAIIASLLAVWEVYKNNIKS